MWSRGWRRNLKTSDDRTGREVVLETWAMKKKYTIKAPLYSHPIEHFIKLNQLDDIGIVLYAGVPNSPLNGGRSNSILDGVFLSDRLFFSLTKKQLSRVLSKFYQTITKANQNGIPFFITFTNIFVSKEELTDENLSPVRFLADSFDKYGVKNGIIINNLLLENFIRREYGDKVSYVSSCTKYVSPDKILSPRDTLKMYLADDGKYDFIVLTPQDSRRKGLIEEVLKNCKTEIIAICNSYCANNCNSYHHYENLSRLNKKSLYSMRIADILASSLSFMLPRLTTCTMLRQPLSPLKELIKIVQMQLDAGIVNFKLGRVLYQPIDHLTSLLQHQQSSE